MRHILIVDDSATIRRMVKASLRDLDGVAFSEAGTGLEAVEHLALEPVAMLVLDLNMPDMHGIEVLRFVRNHDAHRNTPVIVLTTRGDEASRGAALGAGADVYLTKPFVPQALAAVARDLLSRDSRRQPPRSQQAQ